MNANKAQDLIVVFAVASYFEFGGMQRSMLRIALECVRRGCEVHIFTGEWEGERPVQLNIHLLDRRALTNHASNKKFGIKLHQALESISYDCLIGFTKLPGLDIYYGGDPCYAADVDEYKSWFYKLLPRYHGLKQLEAAVFDAGNQTEILLIAHQERERFIHYYHTETHRFHLLPPGINRERLLQNIPNHDERAALRQQYDLDEEGYMILAVGSGFKTKGIDRAIRALAALAPALKEKCKLIIVGAGKSKGFMHMASKLGVAEQVKFAGPRQDVASYYYAADVLLQPSYKENTGTTLIEAMICGLPVLATANCGFAYHVQDANAGLICPVPYVQNRLNTLLHDMLTSGQRDNWKRNGPAYCDKTDLYSLIDKAADVIIARARNRRTDT